MLLKQQGKQEKIQNEETEQTAPERLQGDGGAMLVDFTEVVWLPLALKRRQRNHFSNVLR